MRTSIVAGLASVVALVVLGPACGSSSGGSGFGDSSSSSGGGSGGGSGGSSSSGGSGGSSSGLLGDGGSGADGASVCAPNPGNYDIPMNGCDDDGDGKVDNTPVCDSGLAITGSAHDMANAMGLCQDATAQKWGIVSATFTQGFGGGSPADGQHGILPKFGGLVQPREGSQLGVLSSGFAREWDDSAGASTGPCTWPPTQGSVGAPCFKGPQMQMSGQGSAPPGYPKPATGCQLATAVYDAIGLTVQIKVPLNANGLQFDFNFYSGEWPEYVCTPFNDSFVAWLKSSAFTGIPAGSGDLNISFDAKNNPVSVNNGFFETCTMGASTGCCHGAGGQCVGPTGTAQCINGPQALGGTGFEDIGTYCGGQSTGGGSTGWLTTKAPVMAGETITIQFIIWDTGDFNWDSSVLVDHFTWAPGPTMTGTQPAQ